MKSQTLSCLFASLISLAGVHGACAALPQQVVEVPASVAEEVSCVREGPRVSKSVAATAASLSQESSAPQAPALEGRLPGGVALTPAAQHPLRIGLWGDSHLANGAFREELARIIEGHGWRVGAVALPVNLTQRGIYLPIRSACAPSRDWTMTAAYRAGRPIPVGLGLVYLASTHPGAELALDLRQPQGAGLYQQLALRYTPASTDTTVAIEAGGTVQRVRLPAWQVGASPIAEVLIRSPAPLNTVRIRVLAGTLYVQGLVGILKVPATSIVLDDFAVSSATAKGWMQADPATLAAALTGTSYDMIVLAYGTNEAADSDFTPARYAADLQQTLEHMRTLFPTQTCMLIGPPDRGVLWSSDPTQSRKEPYFYARRHREVAQIQQQLAPRYNCGFWDWQGAMGGAGVSYRWSKNSPAYMQGDLTHLTPLGYRWSAQAFARFLRWYP